MKNEATNNTKLQKPCGAKTRSGGTCPTRAMSNGRCRMHGGASLSGQASPSFKHGRYSKYLPTHLSNRYKEAMKDPELTQLRDEIAIVTMHIQDRMQKFHAGESAEQWAVLRSLLDDLDKAHIELDDTVSSEAKRVASLLRITVRQGIRTYKQYEALQPMIEQRRRLVESEAKRLKDLGQTITLEQAYGLISLLADVVKKHVTDHDTLTLIHRELAEIVG